MRRTIEATVLFLLRTDPHTGREQVLLGKKSATASYGAGLWMPPGGKCKDGESYVDCVVRESEEEVGLIPMRGSLAEVGELTTYQDDDPFFHVALFTARAYTGRLAASREMNPRWHFFDEVPYEEMWPSDKVWMPHVLRGEYLAVSVHMFQLQAWIVDMEPLHAAAV